MIQFTKNPVKLKSHPSSGTIVRWHSGVGEVKLAGQYAYDIRETNKRRQITFVRDHESTGRVDCLHGGKFMFEIWNCFEQMASDSSEYGIRRPSRSIPRILQKNAKKLATEMERVFLLT